MWYYSCDCPCEFKHHTDVTHVISVLSSINHHNHHTMMPPMTTTTRHPMPRTSYNKTDHPQMQLATHWWKWLPTNANSHPHMKMAAHNSLVIIHCLIWWVHPTFVPTYLTKTPQSPGHQMMEWAHTRWHNAGQQLGDRETRTHHNNVPTIHNNEDTPWQHDNREDTEQGQNNKATQRQSNNEDMTKWHGTWRRRHHDSRIVMRASTSPSLSISPHHSFPPPCSH